MNPIVIGIDVGGTKIAGAMVTADGTASGESKVTTPRSSEGADPGAEATYSLAKQMLATAKLDGHRVGGVGIGVPEYVTPDGTIASDEVLAWSSDALGALRSDVQVFVESDVRCAALAERVVGDGAQFNSFLFVAIGTGISHTLCLGDRLIPGHRGEAIALGEMPVNPDAALRPDAPLTLEQQASGRAIEQHITECRSSGNTSPSNQDVGATAGQISAAAIAVAVGLLDPEAVILGGGLGSSSGPYTRSLIAKAEQLLDRRPNAPPILRSRLGNRGGVIGAGLTAHRRCQ